MAKLLKIFHDIDRRVIYALMFVCVGLPLVFPLNLPIKPSQDARNLYHEIERLKTGDKIVLSFDYEPACEPELQPMAIAIIRHCFRRGVKIIAPALYPTGPSLAAKAFDTVRKEEAYGAKKHGEDYVNLGLCAGPTTGHPQVEAMCNDLGKALPLDTTGTPSAQLPILEGIIGIKSVPLIISLSSGDPGILSWIQIAYSRYRTRLAAGSTAVQTPQFSPYIQSRQLCGFLGGLRGAAEYETLTGNRAMACKGMDSQSFGHLFIILLIIVANVVVFMEKRAQTKSLQQER